MISSKLIVLFSLLSLALITGTAVTMMPPALYAQSNNATNANATNANATNANATNANATNANATNANATNANATNANATNANATNANATNANATNANATNANATNANATNANATNANATNANATNANATNANRAHFSAVLKGENVFPPVNTNATGKAELTLLGDRKTMSYKVTGGPVDAVKDVTLSHTTGGRADDIVVLRSATQKGLSGQATTATLAGNFTSADFIRAPKDMATLVKDILSGNVILRVDTIKYPLGVVAGKLKPNLQS